MRRFVRTTCLVLATVIVGTLLVTPAQALSPRSSCPSKAGTLYRQAPNITIWHKGRSLYGCWYSLWAARERPRARVQKVVRLGVWTSGSQFRYDTATSTAVWTVRAAGSDKIWARTLGARSNVLGGIVAAPPTAVGGSGSEASVIKMVAGAGVAAWVTGTGSVYVAQLGSAGAISASSTFSSPPTTLGPVSYLGAWPSRVSSLAATLVIADDGTGDGDECGGGSGFIVSVTPIAPTTLTVAGSYSYGNNFRC